VQCYSVTLWKVSKVVGNAQMARWAAALFLMLGLAGGAFAAEPPRVAASLPPLHGLAAAVLDGVAEPGLLVRSGGSEHAYALKPSDARALGAADLVVWIGPGLESFLAKPIATLARPNATLTLAELPGLTLLPRRTGGGWGGHEAEEGAQEHEHGPADLHLWLDPENAIAILGAIAERLAAIDPERAERYRANAARAADAIGALDRALALRLEPVRSVPFLVFHDAYQYLERRYGLTAVGAVAVDPERPPGPRHLAELREHARRTGARCIFAEPQFQPDLVERLRAGTDLRAGLLDPLGAGLPLGPGHYAGLMEALGESLRTCLSG
jgi:zinc transport system substrate-binding protein